MSYYRNTCTPMFIAVILKYLETRGSLESQEVMNKEKWKWKKYSKKENPVSKLQMPHVLSYENQFFIMVCLMYSTCANQETRKEMGVQRGCCKGWGDDNRP